MAFSICDIITDPLAVKQIKLQELSVRDIHSFCLYSFYCVFSHEVMAAIFVSQNNETAAMLVSQTNPLGVELFSYAKAFFCSNKFA